MRLVSRYEEHSKNPLKDAARSMECTRSHEADFSILTCRFMMEVGFSHSKKKDINFHMQAKFEDQVVIRNAKVSKRWGKDADEQPFFPFKRGVPFTVLVQIEEEHYKVKGKTSVALEYSYCNIPRIQLL